MTGLIQLPLESGRVFQCSVLEPQYDLFRVTHRDIMDMALYQGGVRSGKSHGSVLRGLLISLLYPCSRGLVGALSNTLLSDTTYQKYKEILSLPENQWLLHPAARQRHRWTSAPDEVILYNGSEIWFRHLADPERIKSTEFNWIHIEEMSQIDRETYVMLLSRLSYFGFKKINPLQTNRLYLWGSSNPEEEADWVDETFVAPETPLPSNRRFIHTTSDANIFHLEQNPAYVKTLMENAPAHWVEVYIKGLTGNRGKSRPYRTYDKDKNGPRFAPFGCRHQPGALTWLTLDWNVEPGVAVWGQEFTGRRRDGFSGTWDEIQGEVFIPEGSSTPDVAEEAARQMASCGVKEVHVWGDASGAVRDTRQSHRVFRNDFELVAAKLREYGITVHIHQFKANTSEKLRVDSVCAVFENANGVVRGYLDPQKCPRLSKDLLRVTYQPGTLKIYKNPRDEKTRLLTHISDALGYRWVRKYPILGGGYGAA